ncbi:MAG: tetratricopeptide repeat protein [Alphaproteobacteria bacterium]|nr:tetratricopeptide repeat protein [Alphaproteobacteria bacterium]
MPAYNRIAMVVREAISARDAIDPEAEFEAGNRALADGRPEGAVVHYRRALLAAPEVAEVHNNLVAALVRMEQHDEAISAARAGLTRRADFTPLHLTLANLLAHRGDHREAQEHYRRALAQQPDLAAAWSGLGSLKLAREQHAEAAEDFRRAVNLAPGDRVAGNNLAICLLALGRRLDALALYRDLSVLYPDDADVWMNLGQVLQGLGRHDEAVTSFRRTEELQPGRNNLAPFLMQSLMYQCAWDDLEVVKHQVVADIQSQTERGEPVTVQPFSLCGTEATPALRLAAARSYAAYCTAGMARFRDELAFSHPTGHGDRLRVGYISPDFRQHSVATSFRDLIAAHDRRGFEWFGYVLGNEARDQVTDYFRASFDHFTDLQGLDWRRAAQRVHADRLDLLVDLSGFTRHSALELLAIRPAPVQAHYLGYGGTLGTDCVDYLITDRVHTPPALAGHCAEALVYLPDSFMAASRPEDTAEPADRKACGLPVQGFVFANFNAHYKFDPATFAIWLRLLPGSVMWFLAGTETAMANLRRQAVAAGIDAGRLVFAERAGHAGHLARHRLADLTLDCRHHAGGVTTLDSLWAGVPVLTIAGDNHSARTGASILHAAGLPDLALSSPADYERTALHLAENPDQLARLKSRLTAARGSAPLFDTPRLARHLEAAYGEMTARWRRNEAPSSFDIAT